MSARLHMVSKHTIELIYDSDCPNVDAARTQLRLALSEANLGLPWQEWCTDDPLIPPHAFGYGSPTVLVNGKDVAGSKADLKARACRVYAGNERLSGVPSVKSIVAALRSA